MDGTLFLSLAAGLAVLWFATSLRRWLGMIESGRDLRAGGVSASLGRRVLLRVILWGASAGAGATTLGLLALDLFQLPIGGVVVVVLASVLLGGLLGLASCVELPSQCLCGRLQDELGASLLVGVLAAMTLVALRLLLNNFLVLSMGASVADAWDSSLQELSAVLSGEAPRGSLELLTLPPFLAGLGWAFGVVHLNRLTQHTVGSVPAVVAGFVALLALMSVPSVNLNLIVVAVPALGVCLVLFELCARTERRLWPHRTPLPERPPRAPSAEPAVSEPEPSLT